MLASYNRFKNPPQETPSTDGLQRASQYNSYETYKNSSHQSGSYYRTVDATDHIRHVTGTDSNGRYIKDHRIDLSTNEASSSIGQKSSLKISNRNELIDLLDLLPSGEKDRHGREVYVRKGFEGSYIIQSESDNSLSVFFYGGRHASEPNKRMSSQTFVDGAWDKSRSTPTPYNPSGSNSGLTIDGGADSRQAKTMSEPQSNTRYQSLQIPQIEQ